MPVGRGRTRDRWKALVSEIPSLSGWSHGCIWGGGGGRFGRERSLSTPCCQERGKRAELGDTLRPLSHLLSDLIGFSATLLPVGFFFFPNPSGKPSQSRGHNCGAGRGGGGSRMTKHVGLTD